MPAFLAEPAGRGINSNQVDDVGPDAADEVQPRKRPDVVCVEVSAERIDKLGVGSRRILEKPHRRSVPRTPICRELEPLAHWRSVQDRRRAETLRFDRSTQALVHSNRCPWRRPDQAMQVAQGGEGRATVARV